MSAAFGRGPTSTSSGSASGGSPGAGSATAATTSSWRLGSAPSGNGLSKAAAAHQSLWADQTGPEAIARSGMGGAKQPLPHRAELEAAFGRDLSHIASYQGPEASRACDRLDAHAYAH